LTLLSDVEVANVFGEAACFHNIIINTFCCLFLVISSSAAVIAAATVVVVVVVVVKIDLLIKDKLFVNDN